MSASTGKLTDQKVLIFDVYGTLMDWETGLYNGLKPLLSKFAASKGWSRKEALEAFGSVEGDIQSQFPEMLYADVLAKCHEVLEERLKALSSQETSAASSTLQGQLDSSVVDTEGASSSTSAAATAPGGEESSSHKGFGNSIRNWPIFPDSSSALHSLARHYKLVVLSNVDRDSFQYTHGVLSEGQTPQDPTPYLNPSESDNPHKYWHPGPKSPFTLILTAQDTGCYKPALGGFQTALEYIKTHSDLLGGTLKEDEDVKSKVLIVAQSLPHDHVPASQLGIKSVWIDRQSAVTCNTLPGQAKPWSWKFETLGELAEVVEKELKEAS
ncbi:hypothetical protein EST38_g11890 [Candolleomyces aberdarensis]|uniref:Uncharacterized protein n=1 Tax=Candolleomyces aberdarensis TaxID=2316362 RepID=A0A4Q2D5B1_9AGAR|nr:hypothetical protein EST38_g11890 [Candolleomyces aberdarensis]